jgi:hypothetical protein
MGGVKAHEIGPVLAELNPLPPALVAPNAHSVPVVGGPAVAIVENVPARATGAPRSKHATHNHDKLSDAFIAILLPDWEQIVPAVVDVTTTRQTRES